MRNLRKNNYREIYRQNKYCNRKMANQTGRETGRTIQDFVCQIVDTNEIPWERRFILAFNMLTSITAFLGNFLIIAALRKVSSLHPHSKLLFRCLACTDLSVGLITQPIYIASRLLFHTPCYPVLLFLVNTTFTVFGGASMFTVTAISVDRLLALMLELRYRRIVTLKRVRVLVFVFWLSSTAAAMMYFYDKAVATGIASLALILTTCASMVSYTKIFVTMRQQRSKVQNYSHQRKPDGRGIPPNRARFRKTVSSALWVQITLLLCYIPYAITVAIFAVSGSVSPSLGLAWHLTLSLLYFNSTLNPFLYCWKIREVRRAVNCTIRKLNCCI